MVREGATEWASQLTFVLALCEVVRSGKASSCSTMDKQKIGQALEHLRCADPVMRDVISRAGPFRLKLRRDRFHALVSSILSQQISGKAAASELYLAAGIDSTWIVLVLASSAPTTVTFCPANFSGASWSLSV